MEDSIYLIAVLFAIALFIVILFYAFTQVREPMDDVITDNIGESTFNVTSMSNKVESGVGLFDALFPFLVLGLLITTIITAFYTESSPLFFFICLILLAVVILLGVIFSNTYQQIMTTSEFNTVASDDFSVTTTFLQNLPIIAGIVVAVSMFILFSKGNRGATYGL